MQPCCVPAQSAERDLLDTALPSVSDASVEPNESQCVDLSFHISSSPCRDFSEFVRDVRPERGIGCGVLVRACCCWVAAVVAVELRCVGGSGGRLPVVGLDCAPRLVPAAPLLLPGAAADVDRGRSRGEAHLAPAAASRPCPADDKLPLLLPLLQ
mmetsp:Transcript_27837/g.50951  ORF Transcript_27837/g.50951 Transcript_27837/m.50951 type:complete len:155 (-) Transcript_27837:91-555(-)